MHVKVGDLVKWEAGRLPLGIVVHIFAHKAKDYAVVEKGNGTLCIVRIYEALVVVPRR